MYITKPLSEPNFNLKISIGNNKCELNRKKTKYLIF